MTPNLHPKNGPGFFIRAVQVGLRRCSQRTAFAHNACQAPAAYIDRKQQYRYVLHLHAQVDCAFATRVGYDDFEG